MDIKYFGTDLREAGHYMFDISEYSMTRNGMNGFRQLPFNPEGLTNNTENGNVNRIVFNDYKIIAITGSPTDKRGGCKSVFWTQESITIEEFEEAIKENPVCQKIFNQMPFDIKW